MSKNIIRINADLKNFDSPTDYPSKAPVRFVQFDSLSIKVTLYEGGVIADCSNVDSITLEINDIGTVNSPLPRTPKCLLRKTISGEDINHYLDETGVENGLCHATFVLETGDTSIPVGEKWLQISVIGHDGSRSTYLRG